VPEGVTRWLSVLKVEIATLLLAGRGQEAALIPLRDVMIFAVCVEAIYDRKREIVLFPTP
jgi:hypothetical protein